MTVNIDPTASYEFNFTSDNKTAVIEIGLEDELSLTDVLQAVQNILNVGGFNYVDEIRAISYGDKENKIFSSNPEGNEWTEPHDDFDDSRYIDDLPRIMAEETLQDANCETTKSGLTESEVNYIDEKGF